VDVPLLPEGPVAGEELVGKAVIWGSLSPDKDEGQAVQYRSLLLVLDSTENVEVQALLLWTVAVSSVLYT